MVFFFKKLRYLWWGLRQLCLIRIAKILVGVATIVFLATIMVGVATIMVDCDNSEHCDNGDHIICHCNGDGIKIED